MNKRAPDAGSASVELAIIAPLLMLIVVATIGLGRVALAHLKAEGIAGAAARAASLARTPQQATDAAKATITHDHGASCPNPDITVDTRDFQPGGTVKVTVTCRPRLADITELGLPGNLHITETMSSGLDKWRAANNP